MLPQNFKAWICKYILIGLFLDFCNLLFSFHTFPFQYVIDQNKLFSQTSEGRRHTKVDIYAQSQPKTHSHQCLRLTPSFTSLDGFLKIKFAHVQPCLQLELLIRTLCSSSGGDYRKLFS